MISRQDIIDYFSNKLNYTFKNPDLLIQALTRDSARGELADAKDEIFESLEFVGDRALNMAVTTELYRLNPGASPNELSNLYVAFTRNSDDSKRNGGPLYRVAKELNLEFFIIKSPSEDLAKYGARGKKITNKKTRECHLSDHLEALIGAIYLDSDTDGTGIGMVQVMTFVKHHWRHMGLNEECMSESSFGESIVSNTALNLQKQIKHNNIFITSAKKGNWPQALTAFRNGAQIESVDEDQKTALLYFSAWGNCDAVNELIDNGANIEHADSKGWTAVLHAAERGKFQVLRLLLTEGATVDIEVITNESTVTIPALAAAKNSNEIIFYITINYLYAFSEAQLNFAATQAKEKNKVHVQTLIKRAILQKNKSKDLFNALEELLKDGYNKEKMQAVIDVIKTGADVRVRNEEKATIFHLLEKLPTRVVLLQFILNMKPKLDGIILTDIEENIFQVDEYKQESADSVPVVIDTLENISFKHGDLTNFNLSSIKKFINVNFMDVILYGVSFHPDAVFINTNFTNALADEVYPPTQAMDTATLKTLPTAWKNSTALTQAQQFAIKQTPTQSLFPSTTAASVVTISTTTRPLYTPSKS
ncbi:MAG: ribonuclease III domain-containing protein [Pseudomonadota bacterium]